MSSGMQIENLQSGSFTHKKISSKPVFLLASFLIAILALVLFGLAIVYSAVHGNEDYSFSRQLQGVIIGAIFMLLVSRVNYRAFSGFTNVFLVISIALILMPHLPFIGVDTKGAQSWVSLLGVQFQPGELAKITVILFAASLLSKYKGKLDDPTEYIKCLAMLMLPFLAVMTQPDLGTGLVYLCIAMVALFVGGSKLKYLAITLGFFIAAILLVFAVDNFFYNATGEYKLLKEYQRARLLVFIDPTYASSDEGYNLTQSLIAIGSGGFSGKGYMMSTQATLGFLPEAPTDFIFCVLSEELGFIGVVVLLLLYAALLFVCFKIASKSVDVFGSIIVLSVVGMWLFHILENIGMCCGLMPITGIPLPFISYGSSFMLVNFCLLGLMYSVLRQVSK